jgi:predicted ATP-dependent serine protease
MSYNATTADELAAILQNTFALALQGVIAIDGKDGVGKTRLLLTCANGLAGQ